MNADKSAEPEHKYVSRGALKLLAALESFELKLDGELCLDLGCSTGGFTEVMLQAGASRVIAVDTAYGELAWKLRQDERVEVMERTNARRLPEFDVQPSFVSIDISLVPLEKILSSLPEALKLSANFVALFKPQYELQDKSKLERGVIKSEEILTELLLSFEGYLVSDKASLLGGIESPIRGGAGNREFLLLFNWDAKAESVSMSSLLTQFGLPKS